jgi:N-acetylneuraminate lyase
MTEPNGNEFRGILPAAVTPFDDKGRFWPTALERLLETFYEAGVDGVYVCGQTGEGLLQPAAQRKEVVECAVRCSPRGKHVIAHVGSYSAEESIDLARHAAAAGAHAISSLPPLGGFGFEEIREYYRALASASELPLLIYYFPDLCPAIASTAQALELAAIPNVIGLKFTDFDLYKLWALKQTGNVIYNGRDEVLAAGLLMGADGGIGSTYNIVPDWFAEVYRLARAGKWESARAVQKDIDELIAVLLQFPFFSAIRKVLVWMGTDCGPALAPRRALTPAEETALFLRLKRIRFGSSKLAAEVSQ